MNLFDLGVALAFVGATVSGWRRGIVEPVFRWVGMAGGAVLSIRHTEPLMAALARAGVGTSGSSIVAAVITSVVLGGLAGSVLGRGLLHAVPVPGLRSADRAAGSALGAAGVVFVVWIVGPIAALLPGSIPRSVRDGRTTELAATQLPRPPDLFAPVRAVAESFDLPEVGRPGQPEVGESEVGPAGGGAEAQPPERALSPSR